MIIAAIAVIIVLSMALVYLVEPASDDNNEDETTPTLVTPGRSHFGASEEYLFPESGEIKAGENMTFRLMIEKNKEAIMNETINVSRVNEVYSDQKLPLPEGVNISCTPSVFISYPGESYNVSLILATTEETPGDVYHFRVHRLFDSGITTLWFDLNVTSSGLAD
ncbi:hypothetical protein Mpet_1557 [Methanolacinia petrolearia DSM 11571]|uniref:DUF1616 domain-containing protein n=1 Tax=Methanolacinia petrolearia (strain DSM 11571 / OCM 486 / SEBR 4847) TaxID=679926 RepID=E1RGL9_METP4|nr:hypothetical protein [Methanolacinia petrolearia]ADN36314.1 hypothetical protein Mpet_1557 [Methanolacinia petrolearia DSM 11571]